MSEPNKQRINEALDILVAEVALRLSDEETRGKLSTGEITQLVYALTSARDSHQLTKLKIETGKLKKRFGNGKKTAKTEEGRQPPGSWQS